MSPLQKKIQYLYDNKFTKLANKVITFKSNGNHWIVMSTNLLEFTPCQPDSKSTLVRWQLRDSEIINMTVSRTVELDQLVLALDEFVTHCE